MQIVDGRHHRRSECALIARPSDPERCVRSVPQQQAGRVCGGSRRTARDSQRPYRRPSHTAQVSAHQRYTGRRQRGLRRHGRAVHHSRSEHDRLKQLFRIDGSDDPAYEDKLQVVDEVVECAQRAMQRKAARFFGPEEVEEEEEDMMDMESDDEGDDEDTIVADVTVPLPTLALALASGGTTAHADALHTEPSSGGRSPSSHR